MNKRYSELPVLTVVVVLSSTGTTIPVSTCTAVHAQYLVADLVLNLEHYANLVHILKYLYRRCQHFQVTIQPVSTCTVLGSKFS